MTASFLALRFFVGKQRAIFEITSVARASPWRRAFAYTVIVKKGEHGALFYDGTQFCVVPAVPIMTAVDPTGAGDTFAGGLVGILDQLDTVDLDGIRRAMVHGTLFQ